VHLFIPYSEPSNLSVDASLGHHNGKELARLLNVGPSRLLYWPAPGVCPHMDLVPLTMSTIHRTHHRMSLVRSTIRKTRQRGLLRPETRHARLEGPHWDMRRLWAVLAGLAALGCHRRRSTSHATVMKNERRSRWEKRVKRGSKLIFVSIVHWAHQSAVALIFIRRGWSYLLGGRNPFQNSSKQELDPN
jgi:hypothetical protein